MLLSIKDLPILLTPSMQYIGERLYFFVYQACIKTCFQRLTVQTCGCADPYYPVDIDTRVSVCSSSNITQSMNSELILLFNESCGYLQHFTYT
jgi:Amiloride-sensitive sodium channel